MAPVSSPTRANKDKRKQETKEDVKHVLEEIWGFEPKTTFCKIFSIEVKMKK